jgi:UDPglucose--hexose-1-phosphate uridylyltransferase
MDGVYQRRWHPLRHEWVLVAAGRQGRTFLPEGRVCPLCPARPGHNTEIPAAKFEVAVFENRFPAMRGEGVCEVVVYSDRHDTSFSALPTDRLKQVVAAWSDRYQELGSRPDVRYVFIFENRGEAVGVTLHHPHGQIYAYPFIPPVPEVELRAGRAFARKQAECLQCRLINDERQAEVRMLFARDGIVAYVPNYARWPYEVHVAPQEHRAALPDLIADEAGRFGEALRTVASVYDQLFGVPMPYMMVMHQRPTDGRSHPEAHLHAEFYPLLREATRLKYFAAGECGAGSFVSDSLPEEKAAVLRRVLDHKVDH